MNKNRAQLNLKIQLRCSLNISFIFFFLNASFTAFSQFYKIEQLKDYKSWPGYSSINNFYQLLGGRFVWTGNNDLQKEIIEILELSTSLGLFQLLVDIYETQINCLVFRIFSAYPAKLFVVADNLHLEGTRCNAKKV